MAVEISDIDGQPDMVRVTITDDTRTRIVYRKRADVEHKPQVGVSKISSKNPFMPQSLAIPANQVEDFKHHTGVDFEPTDNGFAVPKFTSMNQWYGYLKATGRHDRDGYR